jgi:hypothetical protein
MSTIAVLSKAERESLPTLRSNNVPAEATSSPKGNTPKKLPSSLIHFWSSSAETSASINASAAGSERSSPRKSLLDESGISNDVSLDYSPAKLRTKTLDFSADSNHSHSRTSNTSSADGMEMDLSTFAKLQHQFSEGTVGTTISPHKTCISDGNSVLVNRSSLTAASPNRSSLTAASATPNRSSSSSAFAHSRDNFHTPTSQSSARAARSVGTSRCSHDFHTPTSRNRPTGGGTNSREFYTPTSRSSSHSHSHDFHFLPHMSTVAAAMISPPRESKNLPLRGSQSNSGTSLSTDASRSGSIDATKNDSKADASMSSRSRVYDNSSSVSNSILNSEKSSNDTTMGSQGSSTSQLNDSSASAASFTRAEVLTKQAATVETIDDEADPPLALLTDFPYDESGSDSDDPAPEDTPEHVSRETTFGTPEQPSRKGRRLPIGEMRTVMFENLAAVTTPKRLQQSAEDIFEEALQELSTASGLPLSPEQHAPPDLDLTSIHSEGSDFASLGNRHHMVNLDSDHNLNNSAITNGTEPSQDDRQCSISYEDGNRSNDTERMLFNVISAAQQAVSKGQQEHEDQFVHEEAQFEASHHKSFNQLATQPHMNGTPKQQRRELYAVSPMETANADSVGTYVHTNMDTPGKTQMANHQIDRLAMRRTPLRSNGRGGELSVASKQDGTQPSSARSPRIGEYKLESPGSSQAKSTRRKSSQSDAESGTRAKRKKHSSRGKDAHMASPTIRTIELSKKSLRQKSSSDMVGDELTTSFASSTLSTLHNDSDNEEGLNHLWIDTFLDFVSPLEDERSTYSYDSTSTASDSVAVARNNVSADTSNISSFRSKHHRTKKRALSSFARLREWWKKELISAVMKDSANTVNTSNDAGPGSSEQQEPFSNMEKIVSDEFQKVLSGDNVELWGSKNSKEKNSDAKTTGSQSVGTSDHRPQDWLTAFKQTIEAAQKGGCGTAETLKESYRTIQLEVNSFDTLDGLVQALKKSKLDADTSGRFKFIYEHLHKGLPESTAFEYIKEANDTEVEISLSDANEVTGEAPEAALASIQEAPGDVSGSITKTLGETSRDGKSGKLDGNSFYKGLSDDSLDQILTEEAPGGKVPRIFMTPDNSLIEGIKDETVPPLTTMADSLLIAGCEDLPIQVGCVKQEDTAEPSFTSADLDISVAEFEKAASDAVSKGTQRDDSFNFELGDATYSPSAFDDFYVSKAAFGNGELDADNKSSQADDSRRFKQEEAAELAAAFDDLEITIADFEQEARGSAKTSSIVGDTLRAEQVDANAPVVVDDLRRLKTKFEEDFLFPLTLVKASTDKRTHAKETIPDLCLTEESLNISSKLDPTTVLRLKDGWTEEPDPAVEPIPEPVRLKKRRPPRIHITTLSQQRPETLGSPTTLSQQSTDDLRCSERNGSSVEMGFSLAVKSGGFDSSETDLTQFGEECELPTKPDPATIVLDTSFTEQDNDFAQLPPPDVTVADTSFAEVDGHFEQPETDLMSRSHNEREDWPDFGSPDPALNDCGRTKPSPNRILKRIGNISSIKNRLEPKARSKASAPEDKSIVQTEVTTLAEVLSINEGLPPSATQEVEGNLCPHVESLVASHAWSRQTFRQEVLQVTSAQQDATIAKPDALSETEVTKPANKTVGSMLEDFEAPTSQSFPSETSPTTNGSDPSTTVYSAEAMGFSQTVDLDSPLLPQRMETIACFNSSNPALTQFSEEERFTEQDKVFTQFTPLPTPCTSVPDTSFAGVDGHVELPETDLTSTDRNGCEGWLDFGSTSPSLNERGRKKPSPNRVLKKIGNIAFIRNRLRQNARSNAVDPAEASIIQTKEKTGADELPLKNKKDERVCRRDKSQVASYAWSRRRARLQEKILVQDVLHPTCDQQEATLARSEALPISKVSTPVKRTVESLLEDVEAPTAQLFLSKTSSMKTVSVPFTTADLAQANDKRSSRFLRRNRSDPIVSEDVQATSYQLQATIASSEAPSESKVSIGAQDVLYATSVQQEATIARSEARSKSKVSTPVKTTVEPLLEDFEVLSARLFPSKRSPNMFSVPNSNVDSAEAQWIKPPDRFFSRSRSDPILPSTKNDPCSLSNFRLKAKEQHKEPPPKPSMPTVCLKSPPPQAPIACDDKQAPFPPDESAEWEDFSSTSFAVNFWNTKLAQNEARIKGASPSPALAPPPTSTSGNSVKDQALNINASSRAKFVTFDQNVYAKPVM